MNSENTPGEAGSLDSPVVETPLPQGSLVGAVIVAAIAAIVGAVAWAAVVAVSNYELGILAWAIGGLVGFAVARVGRCSGMPAQIIAGLAAFCGIALGKYFAFSYFLDAYYVEEFAEEPAFLWGIFLPDQISLFFETLPEMVSPYDLLWIGLALVTAIGMTKAQS